MTEEEILERKQYFAILYERSMVALNIYQQSKGLIDPSVIKSQEHKVRIYKRQLENFLKDNNSEH